MLPIIHVFGKAIPSYWLCSLLGIITCCLVAIKRHKHFKELQEVDITNTAALLGVGLLIGARVLYLLTIAPIVIRNYKLLLGDRALAYEVLSNGMVYYGGLFGALAALALYTKKYQLSRPLFFDFYAPLIPLFHAFGRIGCFLTGCCHGKVSERFGIAYTDSTSAVNGIPYFPIQLVCSAGNLLLFVVILYYERRFHEKGRAIYLYLFLYAIGRFIIEFFRGDSIRGFVFGLSTSQWISLFVLSVLIWHNIKEGKRCVITE